MIENKKYELTNETIEYGIYTLHRIRALKDFDEIKTGELGGWVESEYNLSQDGNCWIYNDAKVFDGARILDNARVRNTAKVYGHALVAGRARVYDSAVVRDYAMIYGNAIVFGCATIRDSTTVRCCAAVYDSAIISGHAEVDGYARICEKALVLRNADYIVVQGFGRVQRTTTFFRLQDGDIGVSCGCFHGTVKQFRDKVKETHGGTKYAQEYLMIADLMELHFEEK